MRNHLLPLLLAGIACLLSGCIALPGQEPFGETTYEDNQAQRVYESVCGEMEQRTLEDLDGYTIELTQSTVSHEFYDTEEYQVAWHEGAGKRYLWYQGRLYCYDGDKLAYRDMAWEELGSREYAARQWELAAQLMGQEAEELTFKHIPLSTATPYLLTAEYPETEWDDTSRRFLKLSFGLDGDREPMTFTLRWQERGTRSIGVSYFPLEGSTSLPAERKIWSFAHDLGLIQQGVPAISEQREDREWSRSMIAGIDFDSALAQAEYQEDLAFPVPPVQKAEEYT